MDEQTIILILAVILLIIGIVLAFFGKAIWGSLMSIIGGMIGWFIGFAIGIHFFGENINGWLIAIIIGFICGFIGSMLFRYLVEVALALITGLLAGGVIYYLAPDYWIVAIIVFGVVMVLAYVYIEEVVGIVTALIGALLAAAAIYILAGASLAVLGFILIFIGGALIQTFLMRDVDAFEDRY